MSLGDAPPELEDRIASILELPQGEQQRAFAALRAAFPQQSALLERCELAAQALRVPADAMLPPGTKIGPYCLVDVLGEGGMGTVYRAEQSAPIQRQVALKVIKPGMDSRQVLARFETERQSLARMQHENIATVHDGGATEDGRPYFVMELVDGLPITEHCEQARLALPARLRLFRDVCAGVMHAHQKGVVHRDLKPSNVIVTQQADRGVPKIIDFGLARATDQLGLEQSLLTEFGQVVGTPAYMSPEQAQFVDHDVDTRSDIYSLGVLLFELITGRLPFDVEARRGAGLFELMRRIREDEPVRPSSYLGSLRGDLDWIALKCLEKDPRRRYSTADALAEDVRRYLEHEAVEACPPSYFYRLKKFLRKRRGLVAAAASIVLALAAGLVVALWQNGLARASAREAVDNLAIYQCRELLAEEGELWPAHPHRVPAIDAWLVRARALIPQLARQHARLDAVRTRALPQASEFRSLAEQLDGLRRKHADAVATFERAKRSKRASAARRLPTLQGHVLGFESRINAVSARLESLRWRFAAVEDTALHRTLAAAVVDFERLLAAGDGALARVEARRDRAATLAARSREHRAWQQAIAAIAAADGLGASERYAGLPRIEPQLGLVPVGVDPESKLWEFAVVDSGVLPQRARGRSLEITPECAIVLVLLPGGRFVMGAQAASPDLPNYDPLARAGEANDDGQAVEVELAPFFIAKHELTQSQWRRIRGENPSFFSIGKALGPPMQGTIVGGTHPVESVDYPASIAALGRLGLRLPTEAQWEFAARGGTTTPWWTGAERRAVSGAANLADVMLARTAPAGDAWVYDEWLDDGHTVHAPVGSYRPNPYGLYDVYGNVWEWCLDAYCHYRVQPAPGDGLRRIDGLVMPGRCARGGGWYSTSEYARSSNRGAYQPGLRDRFLGVRAARPLVTTR